MKTRTALFAVLIASLTLSPLVLCSEPPAAGPKETELEGKMDALNGSFRKLRRQIGDVTKNAESLKLVDDIRRAAEEAAQLIPAKAAELAESERGKFVAGYQAKMKAFGEKVTELEGALKAARNEDAAKILSVLSTMQKEGHKEFRKPERR